MSLIRFSPFYEFFVLELFPDALLYSADRRVRIPAEFEHQDGTK